MIAPACFSLLLSSLSATASAQQDFCYVKRSDGQIVKMLEYVFPTFNTEEFDPNLPDGHVIHRSAGNAIGLGGTAYCKGRIGQVAYYVATSIHQDRYNTFKTNIAGIGMRIRGGINSSEWWPQYDVGVGNSWDMIPAANFTVELVKTGKITAGGEISGMIGGTMFVETGYLARSLRLSAPIVIKPRVPTCELKTTVVRVDMDKVLVSDLQDGRTGPLKDFELKLSCSGGDPDTTTRMYITFTDASDSSNRTSTLSLSKDSTAKNVGLEILRSDNTLVRYESELGGANQWLVGEYGNVEVNIPLRARYIGTSANQAPTPGSANAYAIFTMNYK
ncbi:hypothetical protein JL37_21185 [Achromobacter sp. RTa]|nr:hypothetical protein JL37_21185 [Achromobacter sp. RTa]